MEPKINLLESRIKELQVKRDGAEGRDKRALDIEIGKLLGVLLFQQHGHIRSQAAGGG